MNNIKLYLVYGTRVEILDHTVIKRVGRLRVIRWSIPMSKIHGSPKFAWISYDGMPIAIADNVKFTKYNGSRSLFKSQYEMAFIDLHIDIEKQLFFSPFKSLNYGPISKLPTLQ